MNNQDIRAKILEDIYKRQQSGMEMWTRPQEYAAVLGISEELASFNIQYLMDAGLVKGQSTGSLGTTRRTLFVDGLTSLGVEAVEGRAGRELAVNFSVINISAPVTQSQIAAGSWIDQTQTLNINTLYDLERYLDQRFSSAEIEALKSQLQELNQQIKADAVKTSTLQKIKEIAVSLGPTALVVIEVIRKLLGLDT